jgi:hypothetical protein
MVHTVPEYNARFTVLAHHYSQMWQMRQDMDKFIFLILLKQQQNDFKTNPTEGLWRSKVTIG